MVKGVFLKLPPQMNKYTEEEILADIDFLKEVDNNNDPDNKSQLKSYEGDEFQLMITEITGDKAAVDSLFDVTFILQAASPELVKTFKIGDNKVALAFPSIKVASPSGIINIYANIIEELLRVTTFCLSNPEWDRDVVIFKLRNYIDIFVRWPGK